MATVQIVPDDMRALVIVDGTLVCTLEGEADGGEWTASGMTGYYDDDGEMTVLYDWDGKHVFTVKSEADWAKF